MAERTVRTRWTGGMRAVSEAGRFQVVVDEPQAFGGTDTGPQPTDLLLASVGSCMALATAYVAKKRGVELPDLDVRVTGRYAGLLFDRFTVTISSTLPADVLEELIPEAERVCYVSNTLRQKPEIVVEVGSGGASAGDGA